MRISTRSSKLALKQVDIFLNNLNAKSLVPEIKKQITSGDIKSQKGENLFCLLYTSPSPRDKRQSRMPSSA